MGKQTAGTIRATTAEDLGRIHEIAVAGWTPIFERYRLIVGDELWNDVWRGWEEGWCAYTPESWHGRGIVTEIDGEIAGFATWLFVNEAVAEVGGNAVDPSFQRRGIGSAQIQNVVDMFRSQKYKCAKVHTGMDPAHGPARAEYRNAGLRRSITNSVYLNYLDEVARVPERSSLSFRWAEASDEDLVRQLTESCWATVHDSVRAALGDQISALAFPEAPKRKAETIAKAFSEAPEKVRLVNEDGQPAGFSLLGGDPSKKLGEITAVGVSPEFRGRAIGCALCMDAFDIFRERDLRYARLTAGLGEVDERTRQMCWNVGLYRELPSVEYYLLF